MISSFISDLHIRQNDETYGRLISFLKNADVNRSERIYLLGDIFDLMAGFHKEYLDWYQEYFQELKRHIERGATIYYVEGNHDLHLGKLYQYFLNQHKLPEGSVVIYKKPVQIEIDSLEIYLSHGDEIEMGDPLYKYYKGLISTSTLGWVADNLMPLFIFEYLGHRASKASKSRRKYRYDESTDLDLRHKYRIGVEKIWEVKKFKTMICGHTHIQDDYESSKGFRYFNAGFPDKTGQFLFLENGSFSFRSIK